MEVRTKLYELLSHCIPAETIITQLTLELMPKLDSDLKSEVAHWAAFYEHRIQTGSKEIYHLEAFVAKFMSVLLRYVFLSLCGLSDHVTHFSCDRFFFELNGMDG